MFWRQRFFKEIEAICLTRGIFISALQGSQTYQHSSEADSMRLNYCPDAFLQSSATITKKTTLFSCLYMQTRPLVFSLSVDPALISGRWAPFPFEASKFVWFLLDLLHEPANHHWGEHYIILQVKADQHLQS